MIQALFAPFFGAFMSLDDFLHTLSNSPEEITFSLSISTIDTYYQFTPTAFQNAGLDNPAGTNNGSCKIFSFGLLHKLSEQQTLALFAQYYQDVLNTPDGDDHQNIRHFMRHGWSGIDFSTAALTLG